MAVYNLRKLCLEIISKNLNILSIICKKNNFYIPSNVSNTIFEYSIQKLNIISEEQMEFFNSKSTKLTKIHLLGKKLFNVKDFSFLIGHPIRLLHLTNFREVGNITQYINLRNIDEIIFENCQSNIKQFLKIFENLYFLRKLTLIRNSFEHFTLKSMSKKLPNLQELFLYERNYYDKDINKAFPKLIIFENINSWRPKNEIFYLKDFQFLIKIDILIIDDFISENRLKELNQLFNDEELWVNLEIFILTGKNLHLLNMMR